MKIIGISLMLVIGLASAQMIKIEGAILTHFETPQEAAFNHIYWDSTPWDYYRTQPPENAMTRVYQSDNNEALYVPIPVVETYNEGSFPVVNFLGTQDGMYTQFYQVFLREGQIMDMSLYADNFRPSLSVRRPRGEIIVVDEAEQREDGSYYATMIIDATLTGTYIIAVRSESELEHHGEYHFTFQNAALLFPDIIGDNKGQIAPQPASIQPPSGDTN